MYKLVSFAICMVKFMSIILLFVVYWPHLSLILSLFFLIAFGLSIFKSNLSCLLACFVI